MKHKTKPATRPRPRSIYLLPPAPQSPFIHPSHVRTCVRHPAHLSSLSLRWRLLFVTAYRSDFPSSFLAIFATVRTTPFPRSSLICCIPRLRTTGHCVIDNYCYTWNSDIGAKPLEGHGGVSRVATAGKREDEALLFAWITLPSKDLWKDRLDAM